MHPYFKSCLAALLLTASLAAQQPAGPADAQIQADVTKALDKKQFSAVHASVAAGMVTLSGAVPTYADKEDAGKRAQHRKNVTGIANQIQVAPGEMSDAALKQKLVQKVSTDRIGYGTTAFNAIAVDVRDGVVTLSGVAYGPVDQSTAHGDVANTAGVRDIIDNIVVAPRSPSDDRIRQQVYLALYGYPPFTKYAIDPVKPIRIAVINGNVTLTGLVSSRVDRDVANIRTNSVPGIFKVTNELQFSQSSEK